MKNNFNNLCLLIFTIAVVVLLIVVTFLVKRKVNKKI